MAIDLQPLGTARRLRSVRRLAHEEGSAATTERRADIEAPWITDERAYRLRRLLVAADGLALVLAFAAVGALRLTEASTRSPVEVLALLLAGVLAWVGLAAAHDLYHLRSRRVEHDAGEELGSIVQMTIVWSWGLLLAGEVLGLESATVSHAAVLWVVATILLVALRAGTRAGARRRPWYVHRTLVVGSSARARPLVLKLQRHPEYGLDIVGTVELSGRASRRQPGCLPKKARYEDIPDLVVEQQIHRVILAGPPRNERSVERFDLARALGERGVRVDLLPSWFEVVGARLEVQEVEGTSLLTVPYVRLGRSSRAAKRASDIAFASLALVVALPLLVAIAVAIKLDSRGTVLFRQRRIGRWDKPFELFKFRTMHADAESEKATVAPLNLHGTGVEVGMFKARSDPRVTRVGAFLRKTSLDELPQLWNIVRGEMSVVGPRPLIECEARQVEGHYRRRVELTPGLTGLWQVNGRSHVPFEAMVNLDYLYCTTWSLWGDVKIVLRTVPAVVARRGAY